MYLLLYLPLNLLILAGIAVLSVVLAAQHLMKNRDTSGSYEAPPDNTGDQFYDL